MGNAALIGATKPEQWQDALKVAAVGLFFGYTVFNSYVQGA